MGLGVLGGGRGAGLWTAGAPGPRRRGSRRLGSRRLAGGALTGARRLFDEAAARLRGDVLEGLLEVLRRRELEEPRLPLRRRPARARASPRSLRADVAFAMQSLVA